MPLNKKELQETLRAYIQKVVRECMKEVSGTQDMPKEEADSEPEADQSATISEPYTDTDDYYEQRYGTGDVKEGAKAAGMTAAEWRASHQAMKDRQTKENTVKCPHCKSPLSLVELSGAGLEEQVAPAKPVPDLEKTKLLPVKGVKDKDIVPHDTGNAEELKYEGDATEEKQEKKEKKSDKK